MGNSKYFLGKSDAFFPVMAAYLNAAGALAVISSDNAFMVGKKIFQRIRSILRSASKHNSRERSFCRKPRKLSLVAISAGFRSASSGVLMVTVAVAPVPGPEIVI